MASGYHNNVSQYIEREIHIITRELQERVTFDNQNSIYPSQPSECAYTENTTWISYDHENKNHIIEHRNNNVQTTQSNDTNILYESHHQNLVSSFDDENLTVDSYQETSNNNSNNFQYEKVMYKDLIDDSEYESDNYIDSENNTSSDFDYKESTFEDSIDNFEYHPNDYVDPKLSAENSENSEDCISSHDDYEYSENSGDYYSEDNYEYLEASEDYYYDDDDDNSDD